MKQKLFHHLFLLLLCLCIGMEAFAQSTEFNYPVAPGTGSSDLHDVGSPDGVFSVSQLGGATYAIAIEVPVGLPGATPQISLSYNSQGGNGVAGYGCNISGISAISRGVRDIFHDGTANGISYTIDDAFFLDGQRMICIEAAAGTDTVVYCLESDPYMRIVLHGASGNGASGLWFSATTKDGMYYEYGTNDSAVRSEYSSSGYEDAWYVCKKVNQTGNSIQYGYMKNNLYVYLSYILYGQNEEATNPLQNRLEFSYEARDDVSSFRIHGHGGSIARRLKYITSKTGNEVYRKYTLSYDTSSDGSTTKFSRLTSVSESNGNDDELKPITLEWQYMPVFTPSPQTVGVNINQTESNQETILLSGQSQLVAADLNSDGITDIIHKAKVNHLINESWTNCSVIYTFKSTINNNNTISYNNSPFYSYIPQDVPDWSYWTDGPLICDFNGNGQSDIIIPFVSTGNPRFIRFYYLEGSSTNTGENVPSTSGDYFMQASASSVLYTSDDFDRDGRADIFVMETSPNGNGNYEACFFHGAEGIASCDTVRTTFSVGGTPRKLFTGDYNGDGLSDLMVIHNNGYKIFWNQGGGLTASILNAGLSVQNPWISDAYRMYAGDFNGDGLTDYLTMEEASSNWYIHLGNGDGTFSFHVACSLPDIVKGYHVSEENDMYFTVFVYDMDGDGKSDVFISKAKYNGNDNFDKVHTYWLKSNGSSFTTKKHLVSNDKDNASLRYYMAGDFNGDGLPELANYGFNSYIGGSRDTNLRTYASQNFSPTSGKIISITDGYGKKTGISYGKLTNPSVYTKGNDGAYPVVDCTPPIHVVTGVEENQGTDYASITSYWYERMKCHLAGKGVLGFGKSYNYNLLLNTQTSRQVVLDADCQLSSVSENTSVGGYTATLNTVYGKYQPYTGKKAWFVYPASTSETDYDGNTFTKSFQYDTSRNGMPVQTILSHNDGTEIIKYQSYSMHGGQYLPENISKITKYTGKSNFTQSKQLTYNSKGQIQTSVSHSNTSSPVTTSYTYDDFGNILTSSTSATGVETILKTFVYDTTNRFVTCQSEGQQVMNYAYDQWGNVLTKTDNTRSAYPYTITYTYDYWGNLLSESLPTGQLTTYTRGWCSDGSTFLVTQGTGQPWTKAFYDELGQKTRIQSISWLDTPEEETFTYNAKGQLIQHGRITGSGTDAHGCFEQMQYDVRGRLTNKVGTGQPAISYSYGNNTVTTTTAGRSVTRQTNLWGNVVQVTDTAGIISYSYGSHGKPLSASFGGNTVTMTYDARGRQLSITDPDAGQNKFYYDAYDRVNRHVNGLGYSRYYTYDTWGRLVRDSISDLTTTYTYGQTTSNKGLLLSTHADSCTVSYSYDGYGRLTNETRSFGNTGSWGTTLTYNSIGQLASKQYSNGPTVTYTYDAYGYKDETRANGTLIRKPQLHTGWEIIDKCGTNLVRHWNYDGDCRLSDIALYDPLTMMGHDQSYYYDSATGNLEERYGMFPDSEYFTYDALDRLTHVYCTSDGPNVTSYSPNGNITSQTGIGSYYYQGTKPHAVSGVDNTDGQIPLNNVGTLCTSYGKVYIINDGNTFERLYYGPGEQRYKSLTLEGGVHKRTIYYMGDCEQIEENGNTRRLYYLDGDAIYVKQDNMPDSIWFMFTDRQGSVIAVVDYEGNELFCASYDAWGRQTVEHNDIGFHRGYTGHEMMPEFGLINMNGRLYDPLVCRFVSPDPYIQAPDNSQNFNRYSYCLNNPLKYTDPSGEWVGIDDLIACLVGGTINLGVNILSGDIHSILQGFCSFALGAAAGEVALYGQVEISAILTGAGNSFINQLFNNGWSNIQWDEVALAGGMSLGLSIIGSEISSLYGNQINKTFSFIKNDLLRNTLTESATESITGFIVNGGLSLLNGDNIPDAAKAGFDGLKMGLIMGSINGFSKSVIDARHNKKSPWTGEKTQLHHSDPIFMEGDVNQDLTTMSTSRHQELHHDLNNYLYQQTDGMGHHMRPQRGNSAEMIQKYFSRSQRLDAMKGFYDLHPIKYWDARYHFYHNNHIPWLPW